MRHVLLLLLATACDPAPTPPKPFVVEVPTLGMRLYLENVTRPGVRWVDGALELDLAPGTRGSQRLTLFPVPAGFDVATACAALSSLPDEAGRDRTSVVTLGTDSLLRFAVDEDVVAAGGPESMLRGCWAFHAQQLAVQCVADARALYVEGAPPDPTWCVHVLRTAEPLPP